MSKKLILPVLALIVVIGLFWQFNPLQSHSVNTITPKTMPAVQAVYATGTVEAAKMIPISPKLSARLMTLEVDEGQTVTQGQILAQLEDTDGQQTLKELEAKQEQAQKDLNRAQTLSKSGAISKESLEQAQSNYKTSAASVERQKAEISFLKLFAPEDGVIIRRDGEIGEMVGMDAPVFWMSGGDELRIETEVDEEDIGLVKQGQKVLIAADAYPNQIFNGNVQSITPKGDPVARSYRVRIGIDGQTPLMIGMTAETNIITQEKESALMIPITALNQNNVIIVKDNKPINVSIKTGIKTLKEIEILDGVGKDDDVVQKYDGTILEKTRVRSNLVTWGDTVIK